MANGSFGRGFTETFGPSLREAQSAVSEESKERLKSKLKIEESQKLREQELNEQQEKNEALLELTGDARFKNLPEKIRTRLARNMKNPSEIFDFIDRYGESLVNEQSTSANILAGQQQINAGASQAGLTTTPTPVVTNAASNVGVDLTSSSRRSLQERIRNLKSNVPIPGLSTLEKLEIQSKDRQAGIVEEGLVIENMRNNLRASIEELNKDIALAPTTEDITETEKAIRQQGMGGTGKRTFVGGLLEGVADLARPESEFGVRGRARDVTDEDKRAFAALRKLFQIKGMDKVLQEIKVDGRVLETEVKGLQLLLKTDRKEALRRLGVTEKDVDKSELGEGLGRFGGETLLKILTLGFKGR